MAGRIMWFRKDILSSQELSSDEKLILSSLVSVNYTSKKRGDLETTASTDYFTKTYGMSYKKVEKTISQLESRGFLKRKLISNFAGDVWAYYLNEELNTRFKGCLEVQYDEEVTDEERTRASRGTYRYKTKDTQVETDKTAKKNFVIRATP